MSAVGRGMLGVLVFARAALQHDFVEGLIAAQDALGVGAFQALADRMAKSPDGRALLAQRPRLGLLAMAPRLQACAPGTLGRVLWEHLSGHGLLREPVIPPSPWPETREALYAKARWRETHDVRHVLTGLSIGTPDETLLHAFQLGQHFHPFSLIIVLFGPLYGWREQSPVTTWARVPEAYAAGRAAQFTAAVPFEAWLDAPLDEVREHLNIRALSHLSAATAPRAHVDVDRGAPARTGRDLVRATRPWAREQRLRTWWEFLLTAVVWAIGLALAGCGPVWPVQLLGSVLLALISVRWFAFLHDYEHGAVFRGSWAGAALVEAIGVLTCVPPRVWRAFHNRHHATTARVLPADPPDLRGGDLINRVVDAEAWGKWSIARQRTYRFVRSPITIALGWLVNFVLGACLTQLARDPVKNGSAAFTLAAHLAWLGALAAAGLDTFVFTGVLPTLLGSAIGTWLIYVQHSFPGVVCQRGPRWDFVDAALRGSSFLDLPPVLRWLSGNIGYHHVHHLNPRIPFYRLPEVMAALPELQAAPRITVGDTLTCLRVHAWDEARGEAGPLPGTSPLLHRLVHGLRAGLHTMRFRDFGSNLASVQDSVDVETFERLALRLSADPQWRQVLQDRPRFQKETVDTGALAALPDGTLGRELLRHLADHQLLAGERHPDCPYPSSDAAAYAKIRFRETHDVRHVLTGLDVSVHDEIVLQAFQLGQVFNWFAVTTIVFGPLLDPRRCLRPAMVAACLRAWRAGREAKLLLPVYWERLYAHDVQELRRRFGVIRLGARP